MSDPDLELPATAGGHPDVETDAPELLPEGTNLLAVGPADLTDIDPARLDGGQS